MKRNYVLPALAVLGFSIALIIVVISNRPATDLTSAPILPQPPYSEFVAGAGIVEAATGNIAIGSPAAGIVTEIYVKVGDHVDAGKPLFKIDDRDLQAQLITANARVTEAAAALQLPRHRLENARDLVKRDPKAISAQDLSDLEDETAHAEAALGLAEAQVTQLQKEIERHTVRAPVSGEILQRKMRLGEMLDGNTVNVPLVLGDTSTMHLRVDIDEHDAWRVKPNAKAIAFLRAHPQLSVPLQFAYIEPYLVPKTALTGQSTERADTRVLQVIYSFDSSQLPVYVGQQMDVYIETSTDQSTKP